MTPLANLLARTAETVNPLVLPLAILFGLVVAAAALSFLAVFHARAAVRVVAERAGVDHAQCQAGLESLRQELAVCAAQLQEIREQPPSSVIPPIPQPGLNLSKRSQALRMHRRGDPAVEIASSLGIPRQEVDLLLKVHRIVISNI